MNFNLVFGVFTMYFEVQMLVICNNYESNVGMNGNIKLGCWDLIQKWWTYAWEMQICCYSSVEYYVGI